MKQINYLKELLTLLIAAFTAFVNPILPFFLAAGFFVTLDWYVAYKVNNILHNESFSSEKSKAVLVKFLIYSCCLIAARFVDYYILNMREIALAIKGTMAYLIVSELRSLDEKYYKLKGIYLIKQITDFLNKLLNKFKKDEN